MSLGAGGEPKTSLTKRGILRTVYTPEETKKMSENDGLAKARKLYLCTLISKVEVDTRENVRMALLEIKEVNTRKKNVDGINKMKQKDLVDTLAFLYGLTMEETTKEFLDEANSYKKEGLAEKVIRRIENLWPQDCSTCRTEYSFYPEECTELKCVRCERGACGDCYNGDKEDFNKLKMRGGGIYYLCTPCVSKVKTQDLIAEDKKKASKTKAKSTKNDDKNDEGIPKSQADLFLENFPCDKCDKCFTEKLQLDDHMKKKHEAVPATEEISSDEEEGNDDDDEGDAMTTVSRAEKNQKKKERQKSQKEAAETCIHFERNRCKFGQDGTGCKFSHPKVCSKISKEGANSCKNKTCSFYHFKVCFGSLATPKSCMKVACTFRHLPGTKRPANRKEKEETKKKEASKKKEEDAKAAAEKKTEHTEKVRLEDERRESLPTTAASRGNARKTTAPFLETAGSVQETAGPVVEMMVELLNQMNRMMGIMMENQKVEKQVHRRPAQYEPEQQYMVNQGMGAWGRPLVLARPAGQ